MARRGDKMLQFLGIHFYQRETIQMTYKKAGLIMTDDEKFKWKLPKSIANYANKYFEELFR